MAALQPFDNHPADVGGLEASAAKLTAQAAKAVDHNRLTAHAYQPAVENWNGIAAPELRAAPEPIRASAFAMSDSLGWGATALRYWAAQVTRFNARVAQIKMTLSATSAALRSTKGADGKPLPAEDVQAGLEAAERAARKEWHNAYDTYISGGGRTAASMFKDGPTGPNVFAASSVGLIPIGMPWRPLLPISDHHRSQSIVPFPLDWPGYDNCPTGNEYVNNIVQGAADGAGLANNLQKPFLDAMADQFGGHAGSAVADDLAKDLDICKPPQISPPKPPDPPDSPGLPQQVLDDLLNAGEDALNGVNDGLEAGNNAIDNGIQAADDWLDDNLPEPYDPDGPGGVPPLPIPTPRPGPG